MNGQSIFKGMFKQLQYGSWLLWLGLAILIASEFLFYLLQTHADTYSSGALLAIEVIYDAGKDLGVYFSAFGITAIFLGSMTYPPILEP